MGYKKNNCKRGLLMVPYANLEDYASGANISSHKYTERMSLYLKNCCVACLSAMKYKDDCDDIALVTNIEVPEPYLTLLREKNVKIIKVSFDVFNFGAEYKWSLAFYKLCALYYASHNLNYDYLAYIDSDVYVQSHLSYIWKECDFKILMYNINHGIQSSDYIHFNDEVNMFNHTNSYITHYGGEFFAAKREKAIEFVEICLTVFDEMTKRDFHTTHGDEFIISIVADKLRNDIKNAGAYIYRFWTGNFRLISTCYKYNPVIFLHVPAEKNCGMLRIYNYYIKHKCMPSKRRVYSMLNLNHRRLSLEIKKVIRFLLFK